MSRPKDTRNDLIAASYSMGIRMSEIADQFKISKQCIYLILKRKTNYKMLRQSHLGLRQERLEQSHYRLCKVCGRGFVARSLVQRYHNLTCFHRRVK